MAFALLDHTEEKTTINEILTGTFREKDRQINFAIEELEKTKVEIENFYNYQNEAIKIIDKHRSELKGI